jgi:3-phenylpropionate/trans-cinnamate dioxygenase ferredoxin subunit
LGDQTFTAVVRADAVPTGTALTIELDGRSILVCNSQGHFFAIENKCSHADEPLACGRIRNGWIACPAHGARFDLATGGAMNPPAKDPIRTFALRVVDGMIEIAV